MKFDYLSWEAFATLVTGVVAIGAATLVGLRQVDIASKLQQLQHLSTKEALFERRIKVYDATREMLRELLVTAKFSEVSFPVFVNEIDRAKFLFPRSVYDRLRGLQSEMADFGHVLDRMTDNYEKAGSYGAPEIDQKWSTLQTMAILHDKLDELFGDEIRLVL